MTLELKIPPVAVLLIVAVAMVGCAWIWPPATEPTLALGDFGLSLPLFVPFDDRFAVVFMVLLTLKGIAVALLGVLEFRRASTTVDPRYPEEAASLVTTGVFSQTRNPMYFGMLLCLTALAVWLRSLPAFLLLPVFVLYLNRFQIAAEERAIASRFGAAYSSYCGEVRRWI